jgi:hypothetical protein
MPGLAPKQKIKAIISPNQTTPNNIASIAESTVSIQIHLNPSFFTT